MESKERKFAEALEKARKLAGDQGNLITTAQAEEIFFSFGLNKGQYGLVYDYFKKHKIGLDKAVDFDDYLSAEEKDFLKDYLELLSLQSEPPIFLNEAVKIAKQYAGQGVSLEDLIGEGNLVIAANAADSKEDLTKKIKTALENLIAETVSNQNSDAKLVERVNLIALEAKELAEIYGRRVTVSELAEEGKFSLDEIIEAISMAGEDILGTD
ncbi:MAG: hypothetical protein FWG91_00600 [Lachnospiraceae bacterium]|nr:hypothetical protein [Lachnospiraceae bacterium]